VDAAQFYPQDPAEDEIVWTRSANSNYSAKTVYEMQFDGSLESSFPAQVWNVWTPSRYKVCSSGYFFRVESAWQIAYSVRNGRTRISALSTSGIWKPCLSV
jgi:hypothetical protein